MNWFNCRVSFKNAPPDAKIKNVSESYLVEANGFTEAESVIENELMSHGHYVIEQINKVRLYDVYTDLAITGADRFYNCKAAFITFDENTCSEKIKQEQFVVQAGNFEEAVRLFVNKLDAMGADVVYNILSVHEADYSYLIR